MKPPLRGSLFHLVLFTALLTLAGGCWTGPPLLGRWAFDSGDGMAVSPDGKQIVFVGNDGRGGKHAFHGSDLFLLDLATSKVRRLTDTPEAERSPSFSHSGKLIAYTAGAALRGDIPPRSIWVRSLDGVFVKRLTNAGQKRVDIDPSFSLDDERLTFSGAIAPTFKQDIFVMGVDGKNLRRVTHDGFNCLQHPRFYRGDKSLLFETERNPADLPAGENPPAVISEYDLAAGSWQEKVYLEPGIATANVSVSPDGKAIAFSADSPRKFDYDVFYAASLDAPFQSLNVALHGHGPRCISLVPSQKVAYFIQNDLQIWRVGLDGSGLVRIADISLFDDPLRWKP